MKRGGASCTISLENAELISELGRILCFLNQCEFLGGVLSEGDKTESIIRMSQFIKYLS